MEEKKELTANQRNLNLDLIRCVAVFCVVGVHFFAQTGFYNEWFAGRVMYVMTLIRTFCMVCVPLFMLLTGFLCNKRTAEKDYYKKLIPMLVTYVLACILTMVFQLLVWHKEYSLLQAMFLILNIDNGAIGYGWYVDMYVGLFLLIPFLNGMYHSLQTQEQKKKLIGVLFVVTVLPSIANVYDWFTPESLLNPTAAYSYQRVVPDWWIGIWPLLYYFIGAYIQEYGIKLSKKWSCALFAMAWVFASSYVFFRSFRNTELFKPAWDWNSWHVVIHSILLFIVLLRMDLSRIPKIFKWIIGRISKLSFGIYLCSFVSDSYLYPIFNSLVDNMRMRYIMMPVAVLASFSMAAIMSQLIQWIMAAPKWVKSHVY